MLIRLILRGAAILGTIRVLVALLALPGASPPIEASFAASHAWMGLLTMIVYAGAGVTLLVGGRRDRRAADLGLFYLLVANALINIHLRSLEVQVGENLGLLVRFLNGLEVDAFLALALWSFVSDFPRGWQTRWILRFQNLLVGASLVVGLFLFGANLLWISSPVVPETIRSLSGLQAILWRESSESIFYLVLFVLILAGFGVLLLRSRRATESERRRYGVFLGGLILGFAPLILYVVALAIPGLSERLGSEEFYQPFGAFVAYPALLLVPLLTAYSVARYRVLTLRLLTRSTLRYFLARYAAVLLASVPVFLVVVYLVAHRQQRLVDLATGGAAPWLGLASLLGVLAVSFRRDILDFIDRRFFRRQYDARRMLSTLVDQIRGSRGRLELREMLTAGIEQALDIRSAALLLDEPASGRFVDPAGLVRPLDTSGPLASLVGSSEQPLVLPPVPVEDSPIRNCTEEEQHWLVELDAAVLVPLVSTEGHLHGVLVAGEKRGELAFLGEDLELLRALSASASTVVELQRLRDGRALELAGGAVSGASMETSEAAADAKECLDCGIVYPTDIERCPDCIEELVRAPIPYILPVRFRFEQRLGSGGMGIVYRAADLTLGRMVAIKTLRSVSPEASLRLRREARAAAAVSHPHLAAVYGLESWKGMPLLVLEYLEGGTLEDRLVQGPMLPKEVITLGLQLADALMTLHSIDMLHRDLKPSNIGFDASGSVKLTDFGIARLRYDDRPEAYRDGETGVSRVDDQPTAIWGLGPQATRAGLVVGTLGYLSPEAVEGAPPSPAMDLWSLCLVLLESLAGKPVFPNTKGPETIERIRGAKLPELSIFCPGCPPPMSDFFHQALSRDRRRRPASARELIRRLEALQRSY